MPPEVVDALGAVPAGCEIEWIRLADGRYAVQARNLSVKRLKGAIKWSGPTVSLAQMNDDIAEAAAEASQDSANVFMTWS